MQSKCSPQEAHLSSPLTIANALSPAATHPLRPAQMVRDDVAAGTHTGSSSVTKGLLWLKR